jgi:general secretion pathway protein B
MKAAVAVAAKPQPWGDLTAEQKREWPPLTIGGSIYSDNAASRFVMINGQVVREGEAAAPGVTVERIGPKSAVLRFKDRRVELPF